MTDIVNGEEIVQKLKGTRVGEIGKEGREKEKCKIAILYFS